MSLKHCIPGCDPHSDILPAVAGQTDGQVMIVMMMMMMMMIGSPRDFSSAVQQLVSTVCFKLRRLQPCLISSLNVGVYEKKKKLQMLLFSGAWSWTRIMSCR